MDLCFTIWIGDDFDSSEITLTWKEKEGFYARNIFNL